MARRSQCAVQFLVFALPALLIACSSPIEPQPAASASTSSASATALERARTVRVVCEGNREVPSDELLASMTVLRAEVAADKRREALDRDLLLLHALYFDRGFVDVAFAPPQIGLSPPGDVVEVRLAITEGPKFHVGTLRVHDDDPGAPIVGDLRGRFRTRDGESFSRRIVVEDLEAVRRLYGESGYPEVEAEPVTQIDKEHATIDLDVTIRRQGASKQPPP